MDLFIDYMTIMYFFSQYVVSFSELCIHNSQNDLLHKKNKIKIIHQIYIIIYIIIRELLSREGTTSASNGSHFKIV